LVWGLYQYRWGNVPLFVPAGHGLLYLFALRATRTPLMIDRGRSVKHLALACATLWAVGGLTVAPLFLEWLKEGDLPRKTTRIVDYTIARSVLAVSSRACAAVRIGGELPR
jgi:hypothetical protein